MILSFIIVATSRCTIWGPSVKANGSIFVFNWRFESETSVILKSDSIKRSAPDMRHFIFALNEWEGDTKTEAIQSRKKYCSSRDSEEALSKLPRASMILRPGFHHLPTPFDSPVSKWWPNVVYSYNAMATTSEAVWLCSSKVTCRQSRALNFKSKVHEPIVWSTLRFQISASVSSSDNDLQPNLLNIVKECKSHLCVADTTSSNRSSTAMSVFLVIVTAGMSSSQFHKSYSWLHGRLMKELMVLI